MTTYLEAERRVVPLKVALHFHRFLLFGTLVVVVTDGVVVIGVAVVTLHTDIVRVIVGTL